MEPENNYERSIINNLRKFGYSFNDEDCFWVCTTCEWIAGKKVPTNPCPMCKENHYRKKHLAILLGGDLSKNMYRCTQCGYTYIGRNQPKFCIFCYINENPPEEINENEIMECINGYIGE